MDTAVIDDLKQFIHATVWQANAELRGDITTLKADMDEVKSTMATKADLAETNNRLDETNHRLDETNNRLDETNHKLDAVLEGVGYQATNHDQRIRRLEQHLHLKPLG